MTGPEILRFVLALAFVLGLIALLAWLARRSGWVTGMRPSGGVRRLQVLESAAIDPRHKLVLVRRDRAEHLLLLSQGAPLVLERRCAGAASPENEADAASGR